MSGSACGCTSVGSIALIDRSHAGGGAVLARPSIDEASHTIYCCTLAGALTAINTVRYHCCHLLAMAWCFGGDSWHWWQCMVLSGWPLTQNSFLPGNVHCCFTASQVCVTSLEYFIMPHLCHFGMHRFSNRGHRGFVMEYTALCMFFLCLVSGNTSV